MQQLERLEKILKEDKNSYTMKEIMTTMALCFEAYQKESKIVKAIKPKLTEGEWNSLINGMTMSFFMSLHASKLDTKEALKLADTEGILGVALVARKGK